jgi:hypothetical protein
MSESTVKKNDKPPFTHRAWIKKTELVSKGRRIGMWIDEGSARIEANGDVSWLKLHSLPIGGFEIGIDPNDIPAPQRPDDDHDDAGEEESE